MESRQQFNLRVANYSTGISTGNQAHLNVHINLVSSTYERKIATRFQMSELGIRVAAVQCLTDIIG